MCSLRSMHNFNINYRVLLGNLQLLSTYKFIQRWGNAKKLIVILSLPCRYRVIAEGIRVLIL